MPPKIGSEGLPFIVSTDGKDVDTKTRKFIRSHVMRGKNRVKTRRKRRATQSGDGFFASTLLLERIAPSPVITRSLCSIFSSVRFADTVEPALVADVLTFSSMSVEAMFVLNDSISPQTSTMMQEWFTPMFFDAAYLHAICFTVQAYYNGVLGRNQTNEDERRDRIHYAKAVRLLQDRLGCDDDSVRLSNSTVMTVLALYGQAYTTGDYDTADHHGEGLLKLVKMRGAHAFFDSARLAIEIIRCDLAMAIDSCSTPVLFDSNNIPWSLTPDISPEAISDFRTLSRRSGFEEIMPHSPLDPELAAIWIAMSYFCSLVNAAVEEGGTKMTEEFFLHRMGAVMYRLLHLRYTAGSPDEAFRFALLSFSSPILLNWNRGELLSHRFMSTFQDALTKLHQADPTVDSRDFLWLCMIGALSITHETGSMAQLTNWLREYARKCDIHTWDNMRDLLGSFLWIGSVYDVWGRPLFESILP